MSIRYIEKDARVTLHFTLSLADGRVVDTTHGGDPLLIVLGQGHIAPGLENRLIGLSVGDRRRIDIPAGEVYGSVDADAVTMLAREEFPSEMVPEPGQILGFAMPAGEEVPGLVLAVDATGVQVDFSHPLAGHDLLFDVEILAVE